MFVLEADLRHTSQPSSCKNMFLFNLHYVLTSLSIIQVLHSAQRRVAPASVIKRPRFQPPEVIKKTRLTEAESQSESRSDGNGEVVSGDTLTCCRGDLTAAQGEMRSGEV